MSNNIQINITESVSPPNVATIDRPDLNLTGNTYSKVEIENKLTAVTGSSYLGELPKSYNFPTTGSYTFNPTETGVYTINGHSLPEITQQDFEDYLEIIIRVTDGVPSLSKREMPVFPLANAYDPDNNTDAVSAKVTEDMLFGIGNPIVINKNYGLSTQTSNTNTAPNYVYWISGNPFPEKGITKTLTIRCFSAGTLYIKAYSDNGSSFVYRSGTQKSFAVNVGLNTLDLADLELIQGDILFLGGVQLYFVSGGAEGYTGILGINTYAANSTATISKSLLGASTAALEFRINYDFTQIQPTGGRVANEITNDNIDDKHWPSMQLFLNTIGDSTLKKLTDIILIPSFGQSLAGGTDGGSSTFTAPIDIAFTTGNINSNVQDMNGGFIEAFKEAAIRNNFELPAGFKFMSSVAYLGGTCISDLSKGSATYNSLINQVQTAKNTADGLGKTFSVPAFCWTQGEEDYRAGGTASNYGTGKYIPTEYATKLIKLVDDLNIDIKAITGQREDVQCIMYQTASHNPYTRYPRIAIEQLNAAIRDKRIVLAKTMYDIEYNTADYVHAPNKSYRNMGNHYGIALFDAIIKKEHRLPIYPVKSEVVGNVIYIQFHVPVKPLVLDDVWVSPLPDGNKGFNLVNVVDEFSTNATISQSPTTIMNVELISPDTVKLTLSGAPVTGSRLTYGVNGNGWGIINGSRVGTRHSGRLTGARGNLRDSQTYFNPVSNYFNLYNWCPIFEINF